VEYTRTDLEKYGFRFKQLFNEVEIRIPSWTFRDVHSLMRVSRVNQTNFIASRPAKGSFRNGNDWLMKQVPIKGTGFARIKRIIKRSRNTGMGWFRADHKYLNMVASAMNVARRMLIAEKRRECDELEQS